MAPLLLPGHPHPLRVAEGTFTCAACPLNKFDWNLHYFCQTCNWRFHWECANLLPKIIHPYHPTHPLTLLENEAPDHTDGKCYFCKKDLKPPLYHCSICNFIIHPGCAIHLKRPLVDHPECHEHKLGLFWKEISSACNACGLVDSVCLFECIQCDFVVHEDCIYLPRVTKIMCHQHRLSRTYSLSAGEWSCGVCGGEVDQQFGIYSCNEGCSYVVHFRCATRKDVWGEEPKKPAIAMDPVLPPVHPHPLVLAYTSGVMCCARCTPSNRTDEDHPYYSCRICDEEFHVGCAESSPEITHPFHPHPLRLGFGSARSCGWCSRANGNERNHYYCRTCHMQFHEECAESLPEIKHHFHPRHPLTLLTSGAPAYSDGKCHLCGKNLKEMVYHCSICNFSMDPFCARKPPPLTIDRPKTHEHTLTLLPSLISFTCNACGLSGDQYPYVCIQCDFLVHVDCIYLPRVIRITRHQHRLSHTSFLPLGKWSCGVCRKEVDGKYGEYSCSKGCSYVVHSKCATNQDIWDGKELQEEPEDIDETEDVMSFKVIDDGVINHCSHEEHDLRLIKEDSVSDENTLCEACILPVVYDPFYSCMHMQCHFSLHKKCADLPQKIWHVLHRHPLTLQIDHIQSKDWSKRVFDCSACEERCCGFKYKCPEMECGFQLDARCASISEPFIHKGHSHPLFFPLYNNKGKICGGCGESSEYMLNCIECDFALDFKCATLPSTVRYKYDEHPLTLRYSEEASGKYWCEICEEETDQKKWFYTCDDCGVTSHVKCALGRFPFQYMKPGQSFENEDYKFEMAANNRNLRQFCYTCHRRCQGTGVIKYFGVYSDEDSNSDSDKSSGIYFCSLSCLLFFS